MRALAAPLALAALLALAAPAAPLGVAAGTHQTNLYAGVLAEGEIDRYPDGAAVTGQFCPFPALGASLLTVTLQGSPEDRLLVWTLQREAGRYVRVPHEVRADAPLVLESTVDFATGCPAFDVEATRASLGTVAYTAVALL